MIFTVTLNPARDRIITIDNFETGKVNRIKSIHDDPGGKGINVSKAVKSLGGRTVALGIAGGSTGRFIAEALSEISIETSFTESPFETRTNIKVQDPVNHTTTDINESGAKLTKELTDQVLARLLSLASPGDYAVIAGKTDTDAVDLSVWITKLRDRGVKVFLDTEGDALRAGIKAGPFAIKPNIDELRSVTRESLTDLDQVIACAYRVIKENAISACIVSAGEKGAVYVSEELILSAKCPDVIPVCTTGAGDTMLGVLVYAFDKGLPVYDAFRLSVAAGSAAVTCPGTECPSSRIIYELSEKVLISKHEIPR